MYSEWVGLTIMGLLGIWLGILSFLIWKQNQFLKTIFPKSGERDIRAKFKEVLEQVGKFGLDLESLEKSIVRVKVKRFNPYDDTGGDQSFTVVLLDEKGTGVVITSLHARSGTRIFAKDISLGKSGKYKLSEEEERIVSEAMER